MRSWKVWLVVLMPTVAWADDELTHDEDSLFHYAACAPAWMEDQPNKLTWFTSGHLNVPFPFNPEIYRGEVNWTADLKTGTNVWNTTVYSKSDCELVDDVCQVYYEASYSANPNPASGTPVGKIQRWWRISGRLDVYNRQTNIKMATMTLTEIWKQCDEVVNSWKYPYPPPAGSRSPAPPNHGQPVFGLPVDPDWPRYSLPGFIYPDYGFKPSIDLDPLEEYPFIRNPIQRLLPTEGDIFGGDWGFDFPLD